MSTSGVFSTPSKHASLGTVFHRLLCVRRGGPQHVLRQALLGINRASIHYTCVLSQRLRKVGASAMVRLPGANKYLTRIGQPPMSTGAHQVRNPSALLLTAAPTHSGLTRHHRYSLRKVHQRVRYVRSISLSWASTSTTRHHRPRGLPSFPTRRGPERAMAMPKRLSSQIAPMTL